MGVFIEPPFWAQAYGQAVAPHAVSVRVTPVVTIVSSSVANPSVLTTLVPHGLASGDTTTIAGHTGSTPAVDGSRVVTVLTPTTFSIPVSVSVGGAGGTVTRTAAADVLTLAEAKSYARLTDTSLDGLIPRFLATARAKVQQDTGIILLAETYDVFFDALPWDRTPIELLWRPVSAVLSVVSIDSAGAVQTLAVTNYVLDSSSEAPYPARLALAIDGAWPTDLRPFQPYVIRLVAGYASVALLPSALAHAVGLLISAHVNKDGLDEYEDTIAPYRLVCVA